MTPNNPPPKWAKEYKEFLNQEKVNVPQNISASILNTISSDLHLDPKRIYFKLFILQLFSGAFTLFVCPQFGVGPLFGKSGMIHFVMQFGPIACATFCGSIFIGATVLSSHLLLKRIELDFILQRQVWVYFLLSLGSISGFMLLSKLGFGHEAQSLIFNLMWLLGALGVSVTINSLLSKLRRLPHAFN